MHVHRNVPGLLSRIIDVFSKRGHHRHVLELREFWAAVRNISNEAARFTHYRFAARGH